MGSFLLHKNKGAKMSDDIKANEPDGSKTVADATNQEPKKYDEEYVNTVKAESIERGKKLKEAEEKLKKLEDEKLSDIEKKDKRVKELEAEIETIKGSVKAKEIDNFISEAISDKNIIDKPTMKLLIKNELSSEEEITDKVVGKIVDKLIKDKPFLIASTNVNPSDGNFGKPSGDPVQDANAAMVKFLKS
jgi:hypothetical protein